MSFWTFQSGTFSGPVNLDLFLGTYFDFQMNAGGGCWIPSTHTDWSGFLYGFHPPQMAYQVVAGVRCVLLDRCTRMLLDLLMLLVMLLPFPLVPGLDHHLLHILVLRLRDVSISERGYGLNCKIQIWVGKAYSHRGWIVVSIYIV